MTKLSHELRQDDHISIGGTTYEVQHRYILNGVVTLDLKTISPSPLQYYVRVIMPVNITMNLMQ